MLDQLEHSWESNPTAGTYLFLNQNLFYWYCQSIKPIKEHLSYKSTTVLIKLQYFGTVSYL